MRAVGTSTASETMTDRVAVGASAPVGPVRTCIGCRQRALDTDLLRVVAVVDGAPGSTEVGASSVSAVPDPRRQAPGRGAWVHRDLACVDLAIRRRAFGRALRVSAPIDPARVREYVAEWTSTNRTKPQDTTAPHEQDTTSGTPQEMTSYGHSMKRQQ